MKKHLIHSFMKAVVLLTIMFFGITEIFAADSSGSQTEKEQNATANSQAKVVKRRINPQAISPASFRPDMPFSQAIDILRNVTIPPLNIVVLWNDLEQNADIYRDTPIGIDGVTGVTLRTHLKLLLTSLSALSFEPLAFTVKDGVIVISTQSAAVQNQMTARIYDISDLVGTPSGGGFMAGQMNFGMGMGGGPLGQGMGGLPLQGMLPFGFTGNMNTMGNMGYYGNTNPYGNNQYQGIGIMRNP